MKKIFIIAALLPILAMAQNKTGINTTNPQAELEVKGTGATNATKALRITDNNNQENVTVLDNGFVGIGNETPTES